jgi:RNA polymerase sigma factor (sigma-70 family)
MFTGVALACDRCCCSGILTDPNRRRPPLSLSPEALKALYDWHGKAVTAWAIRLLGYTADSDDVVMEVFVIAAARLSEPLAGQERTFLYRATFNVVRGHKRRSGRQLRNVESFAQSSTFVTESSDDLLQAKGLFRDVMQAGARLPPKQRSAFLIFVDENCDLAKAAEKSGKSPETFQRTLSRALETLKEKFGRRAAAVLGLMTRPRRKAKRPSRIAASPPAALLKTGASPAVPGGGKKQ